MAEHKTLLERLKPEVLTAIENDSKEFPSLVWALKEELNSIYSKQDVKLGIATRIFAYGYGEVEYFNESKFYNLFN